MSERQGDRDALWAALGLICERVPGAVEASFRTTDQDYVGFVLAGVRRASGDDLEIVEPVVFGALADEVLPLVSEIGWDGVMGEDRYGDVTLDLRAITPSDIVVWRPSGRWATEPR